MFVCVDRLATTDLMTSNMNVDPKYSGFNHLSDDMIMPMDKIIENRTEFFRCD